MDNGTAARLVPEPERKTGSFGDSLKREREKRGITLDDVSLSTKIGLRMLRALEEEKFEQLPGGIFNKGFVRAYARHLGIDEEQAVADYLEAAAETAPPVEPVGHVPSPVRHEETGKEAEPGVPWGILAIVLLVLALALSVWSYYTRESVKDAKGSPRAAATDPQSAPAGPSGTATASAPIAAVPLPQKPVSADVNSQIDLAGQRSNAPVPTGIEGVGSTPKNPALSPDARVADDAAMHPSAPNVGTFVVLIEAEENSWVSITADGKTILEGTLIAPAVKAVKAQKQIVVKAGNVGGLSFAFNGKKVPAQGGSGEVKALTFEATGLQ
jgi:cytoskeleton protein RodZ